MLFIASYFFPLGSLFSLWQHYLWFDIGYIIIWQDPLVIILLRVTGKHF